MGEYFFVKLHHHTAAYSHTHQHLTSTTTFVDCNSLLKKQTDSFRMVCVPCIVIPVLLYIWHRFLQPIFLKFWNPWAKVDTDKKVEGEGGSNVLPPGHTGADKVNGSSCPFSG